MAQKLNFRKIWEKVSRRKTFSPKEIAGPVEPAPVPEETVVERIRRSLECPICTDILLDPVGLNCGHTFCLHCLARDFLRREDEKIVCSVCRDESTHTVSITRSMRDVVEAAFLDEVAHRRINLTHRDKDAIATLHASISKSSTRAILQTYVNNLKPMLSGVIIFILWFWFLG